MCLVCAMGLPMVVEAVGVNDSGCYMGSGRGDRIAPIALIPYIKDIEDNKERA